ncbi:MAG TPA: OmpA family protein, partial [Candidatus Omnitrophota bacterium]|nr:OmpA family protein [Candidatus Omnitrophota bacterium]
MKVFRSLFLLMGVATLAACAGHADVEASRPVAVPQPVVAAPQPAPVDPEIANAPRSFTVYFDSNKADIRASAMQIIYEAWQVAGKVKPVTIRIHGYTDAAGNAAHNQKLSERRAQAVADQLAKLGLKVAVEVKGFGESAPAVKGKKSLKQNRRVEITFEGSQVADSGSDRFDRVEAPAPADDQLASAPQGKQPMAPAPALAFAAAAMPAPAAAPAAVVDDGSGAIGIAGL